MQKLVTIFFVAKVVWKQFN